ncbi:MAG: class I SAM-dependent methyltransferase [Anaerolineales bacterium]|nr:class I SAM-dependent methyltransferase [Anaerolineales bacterium]
MTDLRHDADYFLALQTKTGWGAMLHAFAAWIDPQPASLILDAGSGPGLLPAIFAQNGCRSFGVDASFEMFRDALHPDLVSADVTALPFPPASFNLITASNLLFLLPRPFAALNEMTRLLASNGEIALLNPSERMSKAAATTLADERKLQGLARETLLNYAARAERHHRWGESDLHDFFANGGLQLTATTTKMGVGLVRFARGRKM